MSDCDFGVRVLSDGARPLCNHDVNTTPAANADIQHDKRGPNFVGPHEHVCWPRTSESQVKSVLIFVSPHGKRQILGYAGEYLSWFVELQFIQVLSIRGRRAMFTLLGDVEGVHAVRKDGVSS